MCEAAAGDGAFWMDLVLPPGRLGRAARLTLTEKAMAALLDWMDCTRVSFILSFSHGIFCGEGMISSIQ
mgnify:CR=1 FL=1